MDGERVGVSKISDDVGIKVSGAAGGNGGNVTITASEINLNG